MKASKIELNLIMEPGIISLNGNKPLNFRAISLLWLWLKIRPNIWIEKQLDHFKNTQIVNKINFE